MTSSRDAKEHRMTSIGPKKGEDLLQCIVRMMNRSRKRYTTEGVGDDQLLQAAGDLEITKSLYKDMIKDETFRERLRELDIANEDIPDLFDTFDADKSESLTVLELLNGIKKLRGDPRKSDIIGISLQVQLLFETVMEQQETVKALTQHVKEFESKLVATLPVRDWLSKVRSSRAPIHHTARAEATRSHFPSVL